jgi:hypothetical protein
MLQTAHAASCREPLHRPSGEVRDTPKSNINFVLWEHTCFELRIAVSLRYTTVYRVRLLDQLRGTKDIVTFPSAQQPSRSE